MVELIWLLLVAFLPPAAELPIELRITKKQSSSKANWVGLSAEGLTVDLGGQTELVGPKDLQSVQFVQHALVTDNSASITVSLHDGSHFGPIAVSGNAQTIRLQLTSELAIQLPATAIQAIQLQTLSDVQKPQWQSITQSRIAGDTLVLVRSADSLDKIEGIIGAITDEKIEFEFGGQQISAPRSKLAGLRFHSPPASIASTKAVVRDVWGNFWNATQLISSSDHQRLDLVLAGGTDISLPLSAIHSIDWSLGSTQYVADLTALDRKRLSTVSLAVAIPGDDQLFGAQPIRLSGSSGTSLRFQGGGIITYRVPTDYSRLAGTVYLAPSGTRFSACQVQVKLEDKTIWNAELTQPADRVELDVPVASDQRIHISVKPLVEYPVGDVVVWQELRLLK
ncbi:MAG TPA: hypothetical protein DCF63_03230 [Planctomycetaceae bacterium]|nr:hypothetical protein [Planctomycetaceae bacterium]